MKEFENNQQIKNFYIHWVFEKIPNNQFTNDPSLTKIVRLLVWQGARGKESISHAVWPKAHYDALGYRTLRIWFRRSLRPFTPRHAFRGLSPPLPRDAWVSPDSSFNLPDSYAREKYTTSVKSFRASYWVKTSLTSWTIIKRATFYDSPVSPSLENPEALGG